MRTDSSWCCIALIPLAVQYPDKAISSNAGWDMAASFAGKGVILMCRLSVY
jgi:hypothetical protein